MKIKEQTRKLVAGCSKHGFEVVDETDEVSSKYYFEVADRTDEVSNIYTVRRRWRGLKRFLKSINWILMYKTQIDDTWYLSSAIYLCF